MATCALTLRLQLAIVNNVLYSTISNLTKSSIVVQYLRIFPNREMRIVCYTLLALLFSACIYGTFAGIFICQPVRRFWRLDVPGRCSDATTLWLVGAGINVALDWAVWISPMPIISKLRLPKKQMHGVVAVFALGGLYVTQIGRLQSHTDHTSAFVPPA